MSADNPDNPAYPRQRAVQTSLIEGMERPIGQILPSVFTGTNADLMAAVAPLYLTGSVLDVTYGEGKWWDRYRPHPFTFHDLDKVDGVDFRHLPEPARSVETVCFDPPYTMSGGAPSAAICDSRFQERFGIGHGKVPSSAFNGLLMDGLSEVCRVAERWVLVKCMEFAQGGRNDFHDVPTMLTNHAAGHGWRIHDRIVHYTGLGPGGHNIFTVKRARRVHSYLLVFKSDIS